MRAAARRESIEQDQVKPEVNRQGLELPARITPEDGSLAETVLPSVSAKQALQSFTHDWQPEVLKTVMGKSELQRAAIQFQPPPLQSRVAVVGQGLHQRCAVVAEADADIEHAQRLPVAEA